MLCEITSEIHTHNYIVLKYNYVYESSVYFITKIDAMSIIYRMWQSDK